MTSGRAEAWATMEASSSHRTAISDSGMFCRGRRRPSSRAARGIHATERRKKRRAKMRLRLLGINARLSPARRKSAFHLYAAWFTRDPLSPRGWHDSIVNRPHYETRTAGNVRCAGTFSADFRYYSTEEITEFTTRMNSIFVPATGQIIGIHAKRFARPVIAFLPASNTIKILITNITKRLGISALPFLPKFHLTIRGIGLNRLIVTSFKLSRRIVLEH